MKISPIGPAPMPTSEVAAPVHAQSTLERAKAAFTGATLSPSDAYVDPATEKIRQNIRTLKMKTNASPERYLQQAQAELPEENAINTPIEKTNAVLEATQPLSPQYAALARERRALQLEKRELARQREVQASNGSSNQVDVLERLRNQPLSVLQEAGVTYDQLTEAILSSPQTNPEIQALKDELKTLKEGFENKFTERDTQSEMQVLNEMEREARELSKEGDEFSLVRETGSIPKVRELIERTYRETGEVLDVSEALKEMEDALLARSMKIAQYNKIQAALAPKPVPQQQPQQRQMRTLTNRDTAAPVMSSKARALLAFRGELKK